MTIEVLYPELANLYGDRGNMAYFRRCVDAKVVETALPDQPYFAGNDVDMVYIGSMMESSWAKALEALRPYKERLAELAERDTVMLLTGNAMELLCKEVQTETGETLPALGLVDLTAKRFLPKRANSLFLGKLEDMDIVGFMSRFSHLYGLEADQALFTVQRGLGSCPDSGCEGYRFHNVMGTYLLGPVLVLNPDLCLYVQKLLGVAEPKLAFEDYVRKAYDVRLAEFQREGIDFAGHLA